MSIFGVGREELETKLENLESLLVERIKFLEREVEGEKNRVISFIAQIIPVLDAIGVDAQRIFNIPPKDSEDAKSIPGFVYNILEKPELSMTRRDVVETLKKLIEEAKADSIASCYANKPKELTATEEEPQPPQESVPDSQSETMKELPKTPEGLSSFIRKEVKEQRLEELKEKVKKSLKKKISSLSLTNAEHILLREMGGFYGIGGDEFIICFASEIDVFEAHEAEQKRIEEEATKGRETISEKHREVVESVAAGLRDLHAVQQAEETRIEGVKEVGASDTPSTKKKTATKKKTNTKKKTKR